jgi:hypothetical protein
MSINFVLTDLASSVQLSLSGQLSVEEPATLDVSATAVFYAKTTDFKRVFQFQTDAIDVNNIPSSDVKFYVDMAQWPAGLVVNPANAMLDAPLSSGAISSQGQTGPYSDDKMLVKHDFVRYLALKLFNTYYATDIFNNEEELVTNIGTICGGGAAGASWYDISASLQEVSTTGTHAGLREDASGNKYMGVDSTGADNLCRELFNQIAYTMPHRFSNVVASDSRQSLLLQDGDSINFKVTIAAAPGQESLTGVAPIPARNYKIKINLISDTNTATNTVPTD